MDVEKKFYVYISTSFSLKFDTSCDYEGQKPSQRPQYLRVLSPIEIADIFIQINNFWRHIVV